MLMLLPMVGLIWQFNNQPGTIAGVSQSLNPGKVIELTNQVRQEEGLPPLQENQLLSQAARAKAEHMVQFQYWSHISQGEQTPWHFIEATGYPFLTAGENLARGQNTPQEVIDQWLNSPPHRANLLSDKYTEVGIAIIDGSLPENENTTIIVQMLATPITEKEPNQVVSYYDTPPLFSVTNQNTSLLAGFVGLITGVSLLMLLVIRHAHPKAPHHSLVNDSKS